MPPPASQCRLATPLAIVYAREFATFSISTPLPAAHSPPHFPVLSLYRPISLKFSGLSSHYGPDDISSRNLSQSISPLKDIAVICKGYIDDANRKSL